MLDQRRCRAGLDANRCHLAGRWANAADDPNALPVCRFYGSPTGPNSQLLHRRPRRMHAGEAGPRHGASRRSPSTSSCRRTANCGAQDRRRGAMAASPPAPDAYSTMNHRYLVDMTMHEHMAPSSILEGVVMCSPLSSAQKQADAVRLARAGDIRLRTMRSLRIFFRSATRPFSTSSLPRPRAVLSGPALCSRRPAGDALRDRSRSAVRSRLLSAVPAAERVFSAGPFGE